MTPSERDILARLRSAISGWKTEVASAQQSIAGQVAEANKQLRRLVQVLSERADHTVELAAARAEIERLTRDLSQSGMPAGAVTQYSLTAIPGLDALRQDIRTMVDRLGPVIARWTHEVTQAQHGLGRQIQQTASQFDALLSVLETGRPAGATTRRAGAEAPPLPDEDRERLEARVSVLTAEVEQLREAAQAREQLHEQLTAELAAQRAKLYESAAAFEELTQQAAALGRALQERESAAEDAAAWREPLERQVADLQDEVSRLRAGEETLAAAARCEELERQVAAQEQELAERRAEAQIFRADFDALALQRDALQEALGSLEGKLEALHGREREHLGTVRDLLEELDAVRSSEEADLADQSATAVTVESIGEGAGVSAQLEAESPVLGADAAPATYGNVLRARDAALAEANARIAELQAGLAEALDRLSGFAAQGRNWAAQAQELEAALETARACESESVRALADSREHNAQLEQHIRKLMDTQDALSTRVTELYDQAATYAAEVQQLKEERQQYQSALDTAREEVQRHKDDEAAQLAATEQAAAERMAALSAEIDGLRESLSAEQGSTAETCAALDVQRAALADRDAAVGWLREQIAVLEEEVEAHRREEAAAAQTIQELQAAHAAMQSSQEAYRQAAEASQAMARNFQEEIRSAEAALAETRAALGAQQAALARQSDLASGVWKPVDRVYQNETVNPGVGFAGTYEQQQRIVLSEMARNGDHRPIGQILMDAGIITPEQLEQSLYEQQRMPDQMLGGILIGLDYASEEVVAQAVACQLGIPLVHPSSATVQRDAAAVLHKDLCTWHVCVPMRITADRLVVAMANPLDAGAVKRMEEMGRRSISRVVAAPTEILLAIEDVYGLF